MRIDSIIWLPNIIDKLDWKHNVATEEVEEIFYSNPVYRKVQKGHVPGEDLYASCGQTNSGRYLIIFFIYKPSHKALIISARDMDKRERRRYENR
jgi:uncharacterized DUF497 family protein